MTPTPSDKPDPAMPDPDMPDTDLPDTDLPDTDKPDSSDKPAAVSPAEQPLHEASSIRTPRKPLIPRRVWILATASSRVTNAIAAIKAAGHDARAAETAAELAPALKEFRPDIIMIDMLDEPDRGRHVALQLRADRSTRQLPIVLVSARDVSLTQGEKTITGPTRRYALGLDAPSVLNAVLTEL